MKKLFILIVALITANVVYAVEDAVLMRDLSIQNKIDYIGEKILNSNKIDKRIVFVYDKTDKKNLLKYPVKLSKRQVVLYEYSYKFISNDDEMAGYLARCISLALKSYGRAFNGGWNALEINAAPKKFEIYADKRAVDYMVKAGYNPIALITFIQKSCPEKRYDTISRTNLTSKRLINIYEYIYVKYPYFLENNEYLNTESYQNFLLTSVEDRAKLANKLKYNKKLEKKYD